MTARKSSSACKSSPATAATPPRLSGESAACDMEKFRWRMVQRINTFLGTWRACRRPACRRVRGCQAMGRPCPAAPPLPPTPPEVTARMMAGLYGAVQRRAAEADAAEAEEGDAAAAPRKGRRAR